VNKGRKPRGGDGADTANKEGKNEGDPTGGGIDAGLKTAGEQIEKNNVDAGDHDAEGARQGDPFGKLKNLGQLGAGKDRADVSKLTPKTID